MTNKKQFTKQLSGNERIKQILELLDEHFKSTRLIVDDYMAGSPEMCDEIDVVNTRLRDAVEELELEEDFDYVFEQLTALEEDKEDVDYKKLVEFVAKDGGEYELTEFLDEKGYTCIKIESMDDKAKLTEFLEAEIFTTYNDQRTYLS